MPRIDLPIEELRHYQPQVSEPEDFDAWWQAQLAGLPEQPAILSREPVEVPFEGFTFEELVFSGADGAPIHALLTRPLGAEARAGVVQFVGYGSGRGLPGEDPWCAMAGFAHLIVDARAQGGDWAWGSTGDPGSRGAHAVGWMSDGIERPEDYYYRRAILDAVAAVRVMRTIEGVDAEQIACVGGSQGGGLTLAAAALDGKIQAACVDFPFITDIPRALDLAFEGPYPELVRYFATYPGVVEQAMRTLSYVDGANFARRLACPTLFSTGLLDPVCPTSTTFGAYNVCPAPKDLKVYPFGNHAGGRHWHTLEKCRFLREHLGN